MHAFLRRSCTYAEARRNLALGQTLSFEPQNLSDLPHRQSLLGHPSLPAERERGHVDSRITQRAAALVHAIQTPDLGPEQVDVINHNRWTPSAGALIPS
jgi:hypothetical protein